MSPFNALDCARTKCGCFKAPYSEDISLDEIEIPENTFSDFYMSMVNERTIHESQVKDNNNRCKVECAEECLSLNNLKFAAKEVCMCNACGCHF